MILGSNHLGMRHDLACYCPCLLYLYDPMFWEKPMRRLFAASMVSILSYASGLRHSILLQFLERNSVFCQCMLMLYFKMATCVTVYEFNLPLSIQIVGVSAGWFRHMGRYQAVALWDLSSQLGRGLGAIHR